ncbi:flagellar hook-length control protein [Halobacteroides halobius DSM 5150]|uniref:Flagellar hook-length control protein n=1 Tax=Halobacteroides halobius (strain ATCC 35273 / DSM 5150 / MD-1) TaxID=748449 RepID=L0K6H5_HALHC|nr:flagellar hook-length control protein FliK [Halobacteroides halobius]AGB40631.1 flagellar hook-length control protein [Halobacteroides halobius DSM 5150]
MATSQVVNLSNSSANSQIKSKSTVQKGESKLKDIFSSSLEDKLKLALKGEEKKEKTSLEGLEGLLSLLQNLSPKLKQQLVKGSADENLIKNLTKQIKSLLNNSASKSGFNKLQPQLKSLLKGMEEVDQKFKLNANSKHEVVKIKKLLTKLAGQIRDDSLKKQSNVSQTSLGDDIKLAKVKYQNRQDNKVKQNKQRGAQNSKSQSNNSKLSVNSKQKQSLKLQDNNVNITNKGQINVESAKGQSDNQANVEFATNPKLNKTQSLQSSSKTSTSKGTNFNNILKQITEKTNIFANKQGEKITLQLKPESLGRLQIKLGYKDGAMTARILAENSNVKELLDANLAKLKSALEQRNMQVDDFNVLIDQEGEDLGQGQFGSSDQEFEFQQEEEREEFNLSLEKSDEIEGEDNKEETINDDTVDYMV